MKKEYAKGRIEKLKNLINYHRYLYHVKDAQEISEAALDSLKKELFDLEQEYPEFVAKDSPTQRVGGRPLEKFQKIKHEIPMISLNDAFSEKDMQNWQERFLKLLTEKENSQVDFYCELKIDGLAIELVYKNGILETGSTRGDGVIGEDVTLNLKTIEAIPLKLRSKKEVAEDLKLEGVSKEVIKNAENYDFEKPFIVRGEVYLSKKEFGKANKEQKKLGESPYANPRNLAAGSIRQLDSKITMSRRLDSFAYELITDFGTATHEEKHKILKAFGFKINSQNRYCGNLSEVFEFHKHIQEIREKIPFEIDGVVAIVNSNEIFNKLGVVGKAPRGAVAFKFPAKQSTTIVEDIKVQVGRTGALTPVAILKPIQVSGVTISRATLHNENEIKKLGIKIGDTVVVGRAGDVIPNVVKVLKELRTGKEKEFKMPNRCPACGTKTVKGKGEAVLRCPSPDCFAKRREYFYHFVSKKAFDMEGLGDKIVDQLVDQGLVSDPADLFKLEVGDVLPLERFADKSANNLIASIQSRKEISLPKLIYALGIRNVGEETAEDLAKIFSSIENLKKTSFENLEKIKNIGPVTAKSIYEWFSDKMNRRFIEKLKKSGVKARQTESASYKPQKLAGLVFVLTGVLDSMTREKAKEKIKGLGGDVSESVSKNTDYVVSGKEPGSKQEKAKEIGIKMISEEEFLELIK